MSLRGSLHAYLEGLKAAAAAGSPITGCAIKQNVHGAIDAPKIVGVGAVGGKPSPAFGGGTDLYGARAVVVVMVQVPAAQDEAAYQAAVEEAEAVALQIAGDAFENSDLGGRVRDCLPDEMASDWTQEQRQPFAVANLVLRVNVAGQQLGGGR